MGDWPRWQTHSSSCESASGSFTWESMCSSRHLSISTPTSTADVQILLRNIRQPLDLSERRHANSGCWSSPKIRINDQIVCVLPRRYPVDGAFVPEFVRASRGDGRAAQMNCGSPPILLVAACWVREKSGKKDGRTSHAAIGF